jgi:hypothetical protein
MPRKEIQREQSKLLARVPSPSRRRSKRLKRSHGSKIIGDIFFLIVAAIVLLTLAARGLDTLFLFAAAFTVGLVIARWL